MSMSFFSVPSARPALASLRSALLVAGAALAAVGGAPAEPPPPAPPRPVPNAPLVIVERSIVQDQGSWQLDYRLRHDGATGLVVTPAEVAAKVEGWVSNSRVPSHAVPRLSSLALSGSAAGLAATTDVIASADEVQRCRERLVLQVWMGDDHEPPAVPPPSSKPGADVSASAASEKVASLVLAPGAIVRVRLRLEHQHFLFGDYDPLLGQRALEVRLGPAVFRDVAPSDREQYLAQPKYAWPQPPEERRDTRHFVTGPDSLHLEAHIPGNQYYRFPERPVRYGTKMRLRFFYLIAAGTEGDCCARIAQYKDTPTAWKVLTDGAHEQKLETVGRWIKVERVFRTEADATTLALDFRIGGGSDVGEMWIDDVTLEPVAGPAVEP